MPVQRLRAHGRVLHDERAQPLGQIIRPRAEVRNPPAHIRIARLHGLAAQLGQRRRGDIQVSLCQ